MNTKIIPVFFDNTVFKEGRKRVADSNQTKFYFLP